MLNDSSFFRSGALGGRSQARFRSLQACEIFVRLIRSRDMHSSLTDISSFGSIDADNDRFLQECFEDHEAFESAVRMDRFLLVGRKGAGKTSIFKKLIMTRAPNYFSIGHTFSDYPWHYHQAQARVGIPDLQRYSHSWKYLILLTISKIILNQDQSLPYDESSIEDMVKIESFVVDSYGTKNPDITQVFSPSKTLKLRPNFTVDFKVLKAGISPDKLPMEHLPVIVQDVNRSLTRLVLNTLNPEHRYFIAFDELDLGFTPDDPEYSSRLEGLFAAARDLNQAARDANKKLFVVVFLRDDIYERLHFEDKNKITENHYSRIEWDTDQTARTLKSLMEKRFEVILKGRAKARWDDIFDENQKIKGYRTKYDYILAHTFLRPRDMIKFCNVALARFKTRVRAQRSGQTQRFHNDDIFAAQTEYSQYLYREIDDEIHKHLPDYRIYFDALRRIGNYRFRIDDFCREYEKGPTNGNQPTRVLKSLYEFSIIGFLQGSDQGRGFVYRYKNPALEYDQTSEVFEVHLGLHDCLGLKRNPLR